MTLSHIIISSSSSSSININSSNSSSGGGILRTAAYDGSLKLTQHTVPKATILRHDVPIVDPAVFDADTTAARGPIACPPTRAHRSRSGVFSRSSSTICHVQPTTDNDESEMRTLVTEMHRSRSTGARTTGRPGRGSSKSYFHPSGVGKCLFALITGLETIIYAVKSCQSFFDFNLPSDLWARRNKKLNVTYMTCDKIFVHCGN